MPSGAVVQRTFTIKNKSGAEDLGSLDHVSLIIRDREGTERELSSSGGQDETLSITNAPGGQVKLTTASGTFDADKGPYEGRFRLYTTSTDWEPAPTDRWIKFVITND